MSLSLLRQPKTQPKSSTAAASVFDDCFDDDDESPSMLLKEAPVLRRTITSPDSDDAAPIRSYGSAKAKLQVNRQHKQVGGGLYYHLTLDLIPWLDSFNVHNISVSPNDCVIKDADSYIMSRLSSCFAIGSFLREPY